MANNPGSNTQTIDYLKEEVERLRRDYPHLEREAQEIEAEADKIPDEIGDGDTKKDVAKLIKRGRDFDKQITGLHQIEKQPSLERGRGCDQFFFGTASRVLRRNRNDRPGIIDELQAKLTRYDNRLLAEEQERRREEARRAAEIERKAREERERLEREEEEKRLAAERAKKPEHIETKTAAAEEVAQKASFARVEEQVATSEAHKTFVDTLAKPADIMRSRHDSGVMTTMAQESYAEVVDRTKLDKEALWPFVSLDAVEKALRAWAKTTGYTQPMEGAAVGKRSKSVVR